MINSTELIKNQLLLLAEQRNRLLKVLKKIYAEFNKSNDIEILEKAFVVEENLINLQELILKYIEKL